MKYEVFEEKFKELSLGERLSIFNAYCVEHGDPDKQIYDFDEEFFETYFNDPMEAARATFFGKIKSWGDEYIKFNAYANLESMSEYDVLDEIDDYLEEIFDNPDTWEDYIDNEEDDEDSEKGTYVCPHCGHVFKQGEYNYNYDTALLDFVCPDCDWEGNETKVERNEEE